MEYLFSFNGNKQIRGVVQKYYKKLSFLYLLQWMSQTSTKPTHLPKDPIQRNQLIKKLQQKINVLSNQTSTDGNRSEFEPLDLKVQKNIEILKLRIKLIGDCTELSVERIQHLEEIFKHYCTHIFKIGKHMTFQRLQYEKVHLTLDRLCVFLKDFGLNIAKIGDIQYEIIDKQQIVRNFKRLSKNCRDLGFQQFIACLQKLSSVYYDQKQYYLQKTQKAKQQRQARIQQYKKKMKQKKRQQAKRKALQNSQNAQNTPENENTEQKKEDQKNEQENEQNDDLVKNMMEDDKIENPNDQIDKAVKGEGENQFEADAQPKKSKVVKKQTVKVQEEYVLTVEEKIQYFYQLVGVDNVHDFRKKMSQLGLPLFKLYQPPTAQHHVVHKRSTSTKLSSQLLNVTVENGQQEDERRLIELRQKLNIKRERDKHMYSPVMSKQQYEQRKKRREQKQAEIMKQMNISKVTSTDHNSTKQKERKKIQLMDKQLSLDMLNHISFDELKLKFDPKKYVASDESDQVYLNQYGVQIESGTNPRKKQAKSSISKPDMRQKTATTLQRKRTSSNIVQDFKKRAYEMQVKQFHKQAQLSKFVNDMKKKQKFRNQKL